MASGRMPSDVAHAIFDVYVRTAWVHVERASDWPDELALVGTYDDLEEWITTAVGQDWEPMPSDVQDKLGVTTYSEGSSVLRWGGQRGGGAPGSTS